MSRERFLVTGARGFIGSWVTREAVRRGFRVTALDLDDREDRAALVMSEDERARVRFVHGDVGDVGLLERVLRDDGVTHVVHAAGLQTPACRERPLAGATVNVVGTLAVLEAAKACRDRVACVAYASSGAVLGVDEPGAARPLPDDAPRTPRTLYGVFKAANEECARIFWQDHGVRSVGLRPPVVYGPGRDEGLTAGTTLAILAAAHGEACEIAFSGPANMVYVEDVARCFVDAALAAPDGAPVFNMRGEVLTVEEMIFIIEDLFPSARGRITCLPSRLPMANDVSDAGLRRLLGDFQPLGYREGAAKTAAIYQAALPSGKRLT